MTLKRVALIITFIYFLLCILPFLFLVKTSEFFNVIPFITNNWQVLINTVLLALVVALLATVIGFFSALYIHGRMWANRSWRWWFLMLVALPPYVYALSYINLLRFIGRLFPALLTMQISGFLPCVIVETLVYLPLATAIMLIAIEDQSADLIEAALLYRPLSDVILSVIIPNIKSMIASSVALITILSLTDFSIPALFQYSVYTTNIFSDFSATGNAPIALLQSLPLVIISAIGIYIINHQLKSLIASNRPRRMIHLQLTAGIKLLSGIAICISLLQIVIPVLSLVIGTVSLNNIVLAWQKFAIDYGYSLLIAAIGALLSTFIGLVTVGYCIYASDRPILKHLFMFGLLTLAVPGVISGIGWLTAVNQSPLYNLSDSLFMPALGLTIRYLPFVLLIALALWHRLDHDKLKVAALYKRNDYQWLFEICLPMFRQSIMAIVLVIFLIMIGDINTVMILAVPGKTPISITLFNYLHYGESALVSAQSIILLLLNLAVMAMLVILYKVRQKHA